MSEEVLAMPSTNTKRKTVTMRKVQNGFIVSASWQAGNKYVDKDYVAKTKKEAKKIASKFM